MHVIVRLVSAMVIGWGLFVARMRPTTVQMTRALLAPLRPRAAAREIREIL